MASAAQPDMVPAAEVEAIVAKRAAEVEARLADLIMGQMGKSKPTEADAVSMNGLAMAIAQLTDQGTGRKRIAPEEVKKREAARVRMHELIDAATASGAEAVYKLRHMTFLGNSRQNPIWIDHRHRQQPTEIAWAGVPNEAMEPMNPTAEAIYTAFAESIGAVAKRDMGPMRVTASGLTVVKGAPVLDEAEHVTRGEGRGSLVPQIRGRGAPGATVQTNILGTLMPPARQVA